MKWSIWVAFAGQGEHQPWPREFSNNPRSARLMLLQFFGKNSTSGSPSVSKFLCITCVRSPLTGQYYMPFSKQCKNPGRTWSCSGLGDSLKERWDFEMHCTMLTRPNPQKKAKKMSAKNEMVQICTGHFTITSSTITSQFSSGKKTAPSFFFLNKKDTHQ